jgi:glycosyltransferase involved in cell wall biosynthesis
MPTLLTIMLPTTVCRRKTFYHLLQRVIMQINSIGAADIVEVLIDEDEKQSSIGAKRQRLLERATGEFVVGIDSDDSIDSDYLQEIIAAIIKNPNTDHVGFLEFCTIDGVSSKSIFSIRYKVWDEGKDGYDHIRCANPKSVIRRTKALQAGYPNERYGEDRIFSEAVTPLLESEVFIEKYLYQYIHNSTEHNERYGISL